MSPSPEVAEFIKRWEGLKLDLYICDGGKPTVGYGHAFEPHEPQPQRITQEQADEYLRSDLERIGSDVDSYIDVDIAQHEYDAILSLAFNVGPAAIKRSTLLRKVNDRRFDDAAHEFGRWVYASGKKLPGLVKRRAAECAMFERGDYSGKP